MSLRRAVTPPPRDLAIAATAEAEPLGLAAAAAPTAEDEVDEFERTVDLLSMPQVRAHLMGPILNIDESVIEARDWDQLALYVPRSLVVRGSRRRIAQTIGTQAARGCVTARRFRRLLSLGRELGMSH